MKLKFAHSLNCLIVDTVDEKFLINTRNVSLLNLLSLLVVYTLLPVFIVERFSGPRSINHF